MKPISATTTRVLSLFAIGITLFWVQPTTAVAQFDHLLCYRVDDQKVFKRAEVDLLPLQSQFAAESCRLARRGHKVCVPASKTVTRLDRGTPIDLVGDEQVYDRICYRIVCGEDSDEDSDDDTRGRREPLVLTDQFGTREVRNFRPRTICTPAIKGGPPTTSTTTTTLPGCPGGGTPDSNCDAADNDCDGSIDESFVSDATSCGVGSCQSTGATTCSDGIIADTCTPGSPSAETCDGTDEDCDGLTDEGTGGNPTACGVGVCAANGELACTGGSLQDTCSPGSPTGDDNECDAADNDCDGSIDESFVSDATSCGVGSCQSTGATTCTAGVIADTCTPGSPSAETCNGTDEDCDGLTDEGTGGNPTACGVGVCAANGELACTGGSLQDTCSPGSPTGDDNECDAADNDCDGSIDESFVSDATSCGVGSCQSTGATTCSDGIIADTCTPGSPSAETCNGTDEDCDGLTDEGTGGNPTACGVGVCAANGELACTGGSLQDTCSPGSPTGDDNECDAADNDCDGSIDESFVSDATSCGVGSCQSTGATTCTAGVIADTCTPGSPSAETCNGTDEDCDGLTDEGVCP